MKTWTISDTHFGHNNCYTKFTDSQTGLPLRPWASSSDEGDEVMIANWNDNIAPNDKVYHLGDVAIPRRGLIHLSRLHGRKILIRGNHDIFKLKDYAEYFDDILGTHKLGKAVLSHYPIHEDSLPEWCVGNVHGHLHINLVRHADGSINTRYKNVCVEHTNGMPLEWESVYADLLK